MTDDPKFASNVAVTSLVVRVVERLRQRAKMNLETARLHPEQSIRETSLARYHAYENAGADVVLLAKQLMEES